MRMKPMNSKKQVNNVYLPYTSMPYTSYNNPMIWEIFRLQYIAPSLSRILQHPQPTTCAKIRQVDEFNSLVRL